MNAKAAGVAAPLASFQQQLANHWWKMARRDRKAVLWAVAAVVLVLIWFIAIRPALNTLRTAPVQLDALDLQLQQMQRLAAETRELRATPPVSTAQATSALQSATARLGTTGKLSLLGDRATLTMTGVSAEGLRNWLNEARVAARARPVELQIIRAQQGYTGTLVVNVGGAP